MSPSALSVILSTYNQPAQLERVLGGYSRQSFRSFEVVVADDGSGPQTTELIERLAGELDFKLRQVWHEDDGFRKCAILNRAIEASRHPYLLFSDGDCIPRDDFLALHMRLRQPGCFLSGGYFKLSREVSEALALDDVLAGRATDLTFLRGLGLGRSWRSRRLSLAPWQARLLDRLTPTKATWNGHNASGWRSDIERAGGFDERMRYGGEDRELGERMVNAGLRPMQIRHRAICVHLWHERGYVRQEHLQANREIRRRTVSEGVRVTRHGMAVPGSE